MNQLYRYYLIKEKGKKHFSFIKTQIKKHSDLISLQQYFKKEFIKDCNSLTFDTKPYQGQIDNTIESHFTEIKNLHSQKNNHN